MSPSSPNKKDTNNESCDNFDGDNNQNVKKSSVNNVIKHNSKKRKIQSQNENEKQVRKKQKLNNSSPRSFCNVCTMNTGQSLNRTYIMLTFDYLL